MEGLFYCFESAGYPVFQLLRFYPESEYVIAKSIHGEHIDDVGKVLKKFAMDGHKIVGESELVYCGAFSEGSGDKLQFKIENELADPSDTWAEYDLLTFKGTIVSENELQLEVTSKQKKWVRSRTYLRVTGNELTGI